MASDPQDITDTQLDIECLNNDREALNLVNRFLSLFLFILFVSRCSSAFVLSLIDKLFRLLVENSNRIIFNDYATLAKIYTLYRFTDNIFGNKSLKNNKSIPYSIITVI